MELVAEDELVVGSGELPDPLLEDMLAESRGVQLLLDMVRPSRRLMRKKKVDLQFLMSTISPR